MFHVDQTICDKPDWVTISHALLKSYSFLIVQTSWLKELWKTVDLERVYFIPQGFETESNEVIPGYLEVRYDEMLQFLESEELHSNDDVRTVVGLLAATGKLYFEKILFYQY